jgi:hypothetical protein
MSTENTQPGDNGIAANSQPSTPARPGALPPYTLHLAPAPGRPKNKRRVRSSAPASTPGYESTAAVHACEPPQSFLQHLHDANRHFNPTQPHQAFLTLLYTRSLWSMSRADEAFATAINLAIEEQWETLDQEWEELDPASRAVLAADKVATMPGHRAFNAHFSLHLRRFSLIHRILSPSRKAA